MPDGAQNVSPSYWARPRQEPEHPAAAPAVVPVQATMCKPCGAEFLIGARYCHVCGSGRRSLAGNPWSEAYLRMRDALELGTASLVAGILGLVCLLAAISVGLLFRSDTVLDWQAIQMWRIEWTLGAIALFVLGVLLKKK